MFTIIRIKTLIELHSSIEAMRALVGERAREIDDLRRDRDELKDDLRRVFGLKPRVIVQQAPGDPQESAPKPPSDTHMKMNENPREFLARMQREHDARQAQADQDAVRQAIAEFEEVLQSK